VNTSCRCSAKRLAFPLSHFPEGDVDLRIGGDADIGFQIELSSLVRPAI
jgi:hypothetical protein